MTESDPSSVETEVIRLDPASFDHIGLDKAVNLLKAGELIVAPTETVYGLLADPLNPAVVSRVYEVKGRDFKKPLALCISSLAQLGELVREVPACAWPVIETALPGPLTVILKKSDEVPDKVSAGESTVGIRFPDHPVVLALIEKFGRPLAATSANLSGHPSPSDISQVLADLEGKVPLIIDCGETKYKQESTVVDLTTDPPKILREGALPSEKLEELFRGQ